MVQGVVALKRYFIFVRAPELESHHRVHTQNTPFRGWGSYRSVRDSHRILGSTERANSNKEQSLICHIIERLKVAFKRLNIFNYTAVDP